ncbi:MAG: hypothetical protein AAGA48_02625 [Myxococcota bacterium]
MRFGLVFVTLTGCLGSPVVGDWEISDFDRFEIDNTAIDTSNEDGDLTFDSDDEADLEFDFVAGNFGNIDFDLQGDWESRGGREYRLDLDGDLQQAGYAAFGVDGPWDCQLENDTLDCEGELESADGQQYTFEIVFEAR